mmetsp:Transcript_12485/g.18193  ORF Transcript_12485/g.18193 Transcript_12485/m.18193 type:complete len:314 (-) Transcript_12485:26-967(-)
MEPQEIVELFKQNLADPDASPSHAAIHTLAQLIESSTESTVQGLSLELERAAKVLSTENEILSERSGRTPLSVMAGCDMFRCHTHKTLVEADYQDFPKLKERIVASGLQLAKMRPASLEKITEMALRCFKDNQVILVHGYSQVVSHMLVKASTKFHISVLVTECRPYCEGYLMCEVLKKNNIPYKLILDNSVAAVIETVDFVMFGAEAVVESGGVVNRVGTYGISLIAKSFRKPVYVCTESLKFLRLFPLSQRDLPDSTLAKLEPLQTSEAVENILTPVCDLTPPALITLLFTDLGILTPSAISDELIQVYNQ